MPTVTVAGQSFDVIATLGLLRRIKQVHNVDLLAKNLAGFNSFLMDLECSWVVCCEFLGLRTAEEQAHLADQAAGGDVASVIRAVTESLTDFFRESGDPEMVAAITKTYQAAAAARKALADKVMATDLETPIIRQMESLDLVAEMQRQATAGS